MKNFELTYMCPTIPWRMGRQSTGTIYVRLRDGRLSITGEIREEGKGITQAGQCLDTIMEMYSAHETVKQVFAIWERWHLNDMRAGCTHQVADGWDKQPIDPSAPLNSYIESRTYKGWNQRVWQPVDQGGLLSAPCRTCGYKYGTEWLFEELPKAVLDTLDAWRDGVGGFHVKEIKS